QQPSEEDGEGKSEFHDGSFQRRPAEGAGARASATTPETAKPFAAASKRNSDITGREPLSPHRERALETGELDAASTFRLELRAVCVILGGRLSTGTSGSDVA